MKLKTKSEIEDIINILEDEFGDSVCGLDYNSPLELTVALILAAQCTDAMVNKIRPILFAKYPDALSLANADIRDIENIVKPCGFYKNKAKNIKLTAHSIYYDFNNKVPDTMEELTKLFGIGRKSSNIILQECYNKSVGIAVDTHVSRTTYRIGITKNNEPLKQEVELVKKIPFKYWSKINHMLVSHGRKYCNSRKPKCDICILNKYCNFAKEKNNE